MANKLGITALLVVLSATAGKRRSAQESQDLEMDHGEDDKD